MEDISTAFLHFKNGLFHGCKHKNYRQGQAICLYDNGATFIGHYRANQPHGKCLIMLSPDTYFMGSLKQGLLEGPFVLRSQRFHLYSQTVMNRIQGQVLVIDRQQSRARVWEIQDSEGVCIREAQYEEHLTEQKIVRAISPYTDIFPSLLQYFLLSNSPSRFVVKTVQGKERTQVSLRDASSRRLTVVFERERLVSAGITQNGQLQGLGYLYDRKQNLEVEGQIRRGVIDGQGIRRQPNTGRTIFGKFVKGDIRQLSTLDAKGESSQALLSSLKKRIHLHALQFENDYLNERPIYLLRNFHDTMAENEDRYNQFLRQEKGDKNRSKPTILTLSRQPSQDQLTYNVNEYNLIKQALSSHR